MFHKDPNLSLSWTSIMEAVGIFENICESYFKRHKMLIQMIYILYYQGDFMFLMWNL